jgi:hypothetical protein
VPIMKKNADIIFPRERPITRILSCAVGIAFLGAPVFAWLAHPAKVQLEFSDASIPMRMGMLLMWLLSAVIGLVFVLVGLKGATPSWLAKCMDSASRK